MAMYCLARKWDMDPGGRHCLISLGCLCLGASFLSTFLCSTERHKRMPELHLVVKGIRMKDGGRQEVKNETRNKGRGNKRRKCKCKCKWLWRG